MVLGELGSALAGALRKLGEHTVVDEEVMDACLKEAGRGGCVDVFSRTRLNTRPRHPFPTKPSPHDSLSPSPLSVPFFFFFFFRGVSVDHADGAVIRPPHGTSATLPSSYRDETRRDEARACPAYISAYILRTIVHFTVRGLRSAQRDTTTPLRLS